jgi:beta-N-acetylhexosaminidase
LAGKQELEKSVGRLLIGRVPSTALTPQYRKRLESGTVGGICLFRENAEKLEELANLIHEVVEASAHVPVVCTDQEGGAVQRFDRVITPLPSAMALAASNDEETIEKITSLSARQLKILGVNCLLAPVLDVISNFVNPIVCTRAFGNAPDKVAKYGRMVADAIAAEGIVPVGKHFPGHGSTTEDSHVALAINKLPVEAIWRKDLAPFKAILDSLPIVLTGHIWVSEIDEDPLPASLSRRVTHSILREYLGFKGIVMTDDMIMKGITAAYGLGEACVMSVEAGADLILVCGSEEELEEAYSALLAAARSGRISTARLKESKARIKTQFSKKPSTCPPDTQARKYSRLTKLVNEGARVSFTASVKGIAVLRGQIPELKGEKWTVLAPEHPRYTLDLYKYLIESLELQDKPEALELKRFPLEPSFEEAKAIAEEMTGKNCIFLAFRALHFEDQLRLGQMVADTCLSKVAVCVDTPFDVHGLPDWPNILATHDPSDQAMKALAHIFATRIATGASPVQSDPVPV